MKDGQIPLIIVVTAGMVFTWIAVSLRCYTRIIVAKTFGSDDYWMLLALVIFTIMSVVGFIGVNYGIGVHADELTYEQLINGIKCRPLKAVWDPLTTGKCLDPRLITNFAYAISAETIFFDWLFALLPIPMLWGIKMSPQLKFTVIIILSLGIIASSATIQYTLLFPTLTNLSPPTKVSIAPVFLWSSIEMSLGITASSIATLRPLLRSWHILGFTGNQTDDDGRGNPRSGNAIGHKKSPSKGSSSTLGPRASHHSKTNLHSPVETTHFPDLEEVPSSSERSDQRTLRDGDGDGNASGNHSPEEGVSREFELLSWPDGQILRTTSIQVEYNRTSAVGKDMV
ncbi:hypothetical protein NHQ30_002467 [Ciborinia camelliae]|nr:hypothetical protein NHQ30_002467 [Ciborinia camelliae]